MTHFQTFPNRWIVTKFIKNNNNVIQLPTDNINHGLIFKAFVPTTMDVKYKMHMLYFQGTNDNAYNV
jgi:hypothetical protein